MRGGRAAFAQRNPRLSGLLLILLGVVCLGINVWMIQTKGEYYGKLFILGCAVVPIGAWVALTGIVQPPRGAPPPPLWWRIGIIACTLVGLGVGFYLAFALKG